MSLRFKPEVRIILLTRELTTIIQQAAVWSLLARVDVEVNSIDDGLTLHMPTSLHGYSLAVDLDTVGDQATDTQHLAEFLRRTLDGPYDLAWEGDHVHVEWDAHRPPLHRATT